MKENIKDQLSKLAEVKLVYSTKIKYTDRIKINSPDDAFEVFWELWDKEIIEFLEEVKILLLNRANQVLCYVDLSKGVTTGSVIDTKVVLQYALKANASAVIMAHNHPSGNLNPSESDKKITLDLKNALGYANINLLDHLIIVPDRMFSSVIDIV